MKSTAGGLRSGHAASREGAGSRRAGMTRREFAAALAAAGISLDLSCNAAPPASQAGLRLSVTCDMFRGENVGLPFDTPDRSDPRPQPLVQYAPDEALQLARASGYEGFEMFDWRAATEREAYAAAMRKHAMKAVCITANKGVRAPGCGLTDPSEREGFLQEIAAATEAARQFDCSLLVVLSGFEREGVSRAAQMESCVAGLRAAVPMLEAADMTAVVEPINTLVTRPGYFLAGARDTLSLIRRVDSAHVKILFDIYHVQVTDGDLIRQIQDNIEWIGHFQIGDHPGRMQPGTGEINYRNVFRAIHDLQRAGRYDGYAGLEYHPSVPLAQTLAEVRALASFA